jgi:hypothetical protein
VVGAAVLVLVLSNDVILLADARRPVDDVVRAVARLFGRGDNWHAVAKLDAVARFARTFAVGAHLVETARVGATRHIKQADPVLHVDCGWALRDEPVW